MYIINYGVLESELKIAYHFKIDKCYSLITIVFSHIFFRPFRYIKQLFLNRYFSYLDIFSMAIQPIYSFTV